ncbi:hypothetical protein Q4596_00415 [Pseudoalteromonas carrageenovora]|uniref:hypothetical protein n=1 Tax=Pseudoalteromonas carrageenovora TaxID=227 RepID=UPI0026E176D8|nr:hypothetical protein [Pseudoalteromonas carrageenovora]MDO6834062.1 hypothetical protein [Pseudoalteromonas carrageenovora]
MSDMTLFLKELFNVLGIDTEYLTGYLSPNEMQYLSTTLKSIEDFQGDFYSSEHGGNLEVLLYFLSRHKEDVQEIWQDRNKKEILLKLYTSDVISGNYDCFHFDLSKFEQTYSPSGNDLELYRIGRVDECVESIGNSWATDYAGLKSYAQASSIGVDERPIFSIKINDSEVLCCGQSRESELILKKKFKYDQAKLLTAEERREIFA